MAKQSQLEKAIAAIDADIAVLQAARQRLEDQQRAQQMKPARKKVAKPMVDVAREERSA